MRVSKAYIQLGDFIYTAIDGLKQWDYWRRREVILIIMMFAQPLWRDFMVMENPQLWAREPCTAFMLVSEAQTHPEMNWAPWFSKRSSAPCNYPFWYILNVLTWSASSLWAWCHVLETEGRMSKIQNMSRELMKRDICICWNVKWAYLWPDRTSHSVSLAYFHFQCSLLQNLLQHWFRKFYGLIISPPSWFLFFFQLNKVHCCINMSYFSSGGFVHPFSLQESIQTWKPQADFM